MASINHSCWKLDAKQRSLLRAQKHYVKIKCARFQVSDCNRLLDTLDLVGFRRTLDTKVAGVAHLTECAHLHVEVCIIEGQGCGLELIELLG